MTGRWAAWLQAAHRRLGLSPDQFWRLTVLEWRILVGRGGAAEDALTRRELDALLAAHPALTRQKDRADDPCAG